MLMGTRHCGAGGWTFDGMPESATACNCTLCRRYGALWIYDREGERIKMVGKSEAYRRKEKSNPALEIRFCGGCGCVLSWRGLRLEADGRRRMAVNIRLCEPGPVAHLPTIRFDGLVAFDDLPRDGRCVADIWF